MALDWKKFVDELIEYFKNNTYYDEKSGLPWFGDQIAKTIRDMEIKFLQKGLIDFFHKGEKFFGER